MENRRHALCLAQLLTPFKVERIASVPWVDDDNPVCISESDALALAILLEAATPVFDVVTPAELEELADVYVAEGAAAVRAKLHASQPLYPWPEPVDRSSFELSRLYESFLIRSVVGKVEFSPALRDISHDLGVKCVSPDDGRELSKVEPNIDFAFTVERAISDKPAPWAILADDPAAAVEEILAGLATTISVQRLIAEGFLRLEDGMAHLCDGAGSKEAWERVGARVAAKMWQAAQRQGSPFQSWLHRVCWFWTWVDAPQFMRARERADLLDKALLAVTDEPSVQGLDREQHRLLADCGVEFGNRAETIVVSQWRLPKMRDSPYSRYVWLEAWEDAAERFTRMSTRSSRSLVERVISMIVHYDRGSEGGATGAYSRILRLVEQGEDAPKLLQFTSQALRKYRPDGAALLLSNTGTASLGVALLEQAQLMPRTQWYSYGDENHVLRQRRHLWTEALIALGHRLELAYANDTPEATALALAEVLLPVCERVRQRSLSRHAVWHDVAGNERQLQDLLSWAAGLVYGRSVRGNHRKPPVMVWCAEPFIGAIGAAARANTPGFGGLPQSQMRLLLWLHDVSRRRATLVPKGAGRQSQILAADALLRLWTISLEHAVVQCPGGPEHLQPLTWLSSDEIVPSGEWAALAGTLADEGRLQALLVPVDFSAAIRSLGQQPPSRGYSSSSDTIESAEGWRTLLSAWRIKLRVHTRMLCTLGLDGETLRATHVIALGMQRQVTEELDKLIRTHTQDDVYAGGIDLFEQLAEDDLHAGSPEPLATLVGRTIAVLSQDNARKLAVACAQAIGSIGVLADIAREVGAEPARLPLVRRIMELGTSEFVESSFTFRALERSLAALGTLGLSDRVNELLMYTHSRIERHPHANRWHALGFRVKLLELARIGDVAGVRAFPSPSFVTGRTGTNQIRDLVQESERERRFYLALALEHSAPRKSVEILEDLTASEPGKFLFSINLLSARLSSAETHDLPEQTAQTSIDALAQFDQLSVEAPNTANTQAAVARERLRAMANAGLEREFDTYLDSVGPKIRSNTEVVKLVAQVFAARGLVEQSHTVLDNAIGQLPDGSDIRRSLTDMRGEPIMSGPHSSIGPSAEVAITASDRIRDIQRAFGRIRRLGPDEVAAALDRDSFGDMFMHELVAAASELVDLCASVFPRTTEEDRYNDLLFSILKHRLEHLEMQVHGQSRGGSSARGSLGQTGKSRGGVGERDARISVPGGGGVATFVECLRLRSDLSEVGTHVDKLVDNYNSVLCRDVFIVGFARSAASPAPWDEYMTYIGNSTNYARAPLTREPEALCHRYSSTQGALRVARTQHRLGDDHIVSVYHLYVVLPDYEKRES